METQAATGWGMCWTKSRLLAEEGGSEGWPGILSLVTSTDSKSTGGAESRLGDLGEVGTKEASLSVFARRGRRHFRPLGRKAAKVSERPLVEPSWPLWLGVKQGTLRVPGRKLEKSPGQNKRKDETRE